MKTAILAALLALSACSAEAPAPSADTTSADTNCELLMHCPLCDVLTCGDAYVTSDNGDHYRCDQPVSPGSTELDCYWPPVRAAQHCDCDHRE